MGDCARAKSQLGAQCGSSGAWLARGANIVVAALFLCQQTQVSPTPLRDTRQRTLGLCWLNHGGADSRRRSQARRPWVPVHIGIRLLSMAQGRWDHGVMQDGGGGPLAHVDTQCVTHDLSNRHAKCGVTACWKHGKTRMFYVFL